MSATRTEAPKAPTKKQQMSLARQLDRALLLLYRQADVPLGHAVGGIINLLTTPGPEPDATEALAVSMLRQAIGSPALGADADDGGDEAPNE